MEAALLVQYVYNAGVGFRLFVLLAARVNWLSASIEDIKLSGSAAGTGEGQQTCTCNSA